MDIEERFVAAIQSFWDSRKANQDKQRTKGRIDAGLRGAVTGGGQMNAMASLVAELMREADLPEAEVFTQQGIDLPGYFRPEKKWDLLVMSRKRLVCAIEFKSQVGPSFGNNFNNRAEEAIGNAVDLWTAYREGLLGTNPRPFLGYFFLLEDCPRVHRPVSATETHFGVDPVFQGASYSQRYEHLCRRLILERHYEGVCLALATNAPATAVSHPADDLSFTRFTNDLRSIAVRFA